MNKDLLLYEKTSPGRRTLRLAPIDVPTKSLDSLLPKNRLRQKPPVLPEIGELDLVRHYTILSSKNTAISNSFYPLGSCTMKYNPVLNEAAAAMPAFRDIHPLQRDEEVQGMLAIYSRVTADLANLTGLPGVTVHPAAGAQGELTALLIAQAYFHEKKELQRTKVLIPDSAHGTNPASCTIAGFTTITVKSGDDGLVDLADLKSKLSPEVAAIMITNPNTLGLFEERIVEITQAMHSNGSLVYMDGANFNAIMGITRPGDFGVDMMHLNLHKSFSTPHGGGGPGCGAVAVSKVLEPYLPAPRVREENGKFRMDWNPPKSIGMMRGYAGNSGVVLRAYTYLRRLGREGVKRVAQNAVLNANYLRAKIRGAFHIPFDRICMHEFIATTKLQKENGIKAFDVAKRLIDLGYHPPTIYFPLIVHEAMMIEPTETEAKETLDAFANDMKRIAQEAKDNPDLLHAAPITTPVGRLDEARAVKDPTLCYRCS